MRYNLCCPSAFKANEKPAAVRCSEAEAVQVQTHKNTRYKRRVLNRGYCPCVSLEWRGLFDIVNSDGPSFFHRQPIRSDAKMPMPAVLSHRMLGIHIMSVCVCVCVCARDIVPTQVY